jgi:glutamyl-tRNA synthetase
MPQFAHLPLLLKPDGNGKLSKRDADKMGFPIFPLNWSDPATGELAKGYRETGYLPEALLNFLAFLGWNPGTEQELFDIDELTEAFTLERIVKAGARFDIQKAQWYNQQYIRKKSDEELLGYLQDAIQAAGIPGVGREKGLKIARAMRDRITFPKDIFERAKFFFADPETTDAHVLAKKLTAESAVCLSAFADQIVETKDLTADHAKSMLEETAGKFNLKPGQLLQVLRISLTGDSSGPDLMLTLEILGGTESARRIRKTIATHTSKVA